MVVDQNHVQTLIAALNTDGTTIVSVKVNSINNGLSASDGSTGSDHGTTNAQRNNNHEPVLIAVSSADGITPVEVYADSSGNLLIKST